MEELKREKLNADWVSLQEEITEYRVILGGWKEYTDIPMKLAVSPSPHAEDEAEEEEHEEEEEEQEQEEEPAKVVEPLKLGKRKREDDAKAGDQDNDQPCSIM